MKFLVTIVQNGDIEKEEYVYELDAADAEEAKALAFRAHDASGNRNWGIRTYPSTVIALDDKPTKRKDDVNDGQHGARLSRRVVH